MSANNSLENLYGRLKKAIGVNFKNDFAVEVIVQSIGPVGINGNCFVVKQNGSNQKDRDIMLKCYTKMSIADLNEGDRIRLKGRLLTNKNCEMVIRTEFFYKVDEHAEVSQNTIEYVRARNTLIKKEKCQEMIRGFQTTALPSEVNNIGLIVIDNHQTVLNQFKEKFSQSCRGNLYVYQVDSTRLSDGVMVALEYFQKYNKIDAICIITEQVSLNQIYQLSKKQLVIKLINRNKFPYLMTSIQCEGNTLSKDLQDETMIGTTQPLISIIANKNFNNHDDMINYISHVQTKYMNTIEQAIKDTSNRLINNLHNIKNHLMDHQITFQTINSSIEKRQHREIESLRTLLLKRVEKEINRLSHIDTLIVKNIMKDDHMTKLMNVTIAKYEKQRRKDHSLIDSTKRTALEKIENNIDDIDNLNNKQNSNNKHGEQQTNQYNQYNQYNQRFDPTDEDSFGDF